MKRRDASHKIVIGTGTFFILPAASVSCEKDPVVNGGTNKHIEIDLDDPTYVNLKTAGGFVIVKQVIVANTGNDTFVAVSSICTHQGCTIGFNAANNTFPCPCHGSIYDSAGNVLQGPTVTALKRYGVKMTGNILLIF